MWIELIPKLPERSAAMRLDHRAAGRREFCLVLLEAGAHLRRLADELRAEALGIGAAGHLLLHRRTGLGGSLREGRDHEGESESGGFHRGVGHGSTFSMGVGVKA